MANEWCACAVVPTRAAAAAAQAVVHRRVLVARASLIYMPLVVTTAGVTPTRMMSCGIPRRNGLEAPHDLFVRKTFDRDALARGRGARRDSDCIFLKVERCCEQRFERAVRS